MNRKTAARIGAIGLAVFAILFATIELAVRTGSPEQERGVAKLVTGRDPLDVELLRCGHLGDVGPPDVSCLRAWAENRRRFLGRGSTPSVFPAPKGSARPEGDQPRGSDTAGDAASSAGLPSASTQGR